MPENTHIAIVGPSGSGKTWLARRLVSALGPNASYIALDDFYQDLSLICLAERSRRNFDDPAAIDWDSVRAVMDALSAGKMAQLPDYDFATHTRRPVSRRLEPHAFMVWDGLWLLHEPWLRERFAFSVFVNCSAAERLSRRLARDVAERGRTPESVRQQFEEQVEPMRARFVDPQRQWATAPIRSPMGADVVDALLTRILALARERKPSETLAT